MTSRSLFLASAIGLLLGCREKAPAEAIASDAGATTTPRPPETANADAALASASPSAAPEPDPPGPLPPPPPAVDRASLLRAVRTSYPRAALGASARPDTVTLTFGPGPTADNASTFTATFLQRHQGVLGAGPLSNVFSSAAWARSTVGHSLRRSTGDDYRRSDLMPMGSQRALA